MIKRFFSSILQSPEPVRRRWFFVFTGAALPIVIGVWVFSLRLSFQATNSAPVEMSTFGKLYAELLSGFQGAKEGLTNVNLNLRLPTMPTGSSTNLVGEPTRPRVHLPLLH